MQHRGLRNLQEVQSSLHIKLTWNLIQGKSTWSQFFLAKYVGQKHITTVDTRKGSKFWKLLMSNLAVVLRNSKWRVREGKLSFWRDKWLSDGPIIEQQEVSELPDLLLADCKTENDGM